jgi:hypothetical protein
MLDRVAFIWSGPGLYDEEKFVWSIPRTSVPFNTFLILFGNSLSLQKSNKLRLLICLKSKKTG